MVQYRLTGEKKDKPVNRKENVYTKLSSRVSLRLGHLRGLTVHRTVIQYPQAASLLAAARNDRIGGRLRIASLHFQWRWIAKQDGGVSLAKV